MNPTQDVTRKALDRFTYLGSLYNIHCDQLTPCSIFSEIPPPENKAIKHHETPNIYYTFDEENTYSSTMKKLHIESGLKVNILAGIADVQAKVKFLRLVNKNSNVVQMTMIYQIDTCLETLHLSHTELKPYIVETAFQAPSATHVVTRIKWGAYVLASFSTHVEKDRKRQDIKGELKAAVSKLGPLVSGGAGLNVERTNNKQSGLDSVHIELVGDIIVNKLPTTIEEVHDLLPTIPNLIKNINGGKGKQVEFTLTPIAEVARQLGISNTSVAINRFIGHLGSSIVRRIESESDEILETTRKVTEIDENVKKYRNHLQDEAYIEVMSQKGRVQDNVDQFTEDLANLLNEYYSASDENAVKSNIINRLNERNKQSNKDLVTLSQKIRPLKSKVKIVQRLQEEGVTCLERGEYLSSHLLSPDEIYVLVLNGGLLDDDNDEFRKLLYSFRKLMEQKKDKVKFLMCDLTLAADYQVTRTGKVVPRIDHYRNGSFVSTIDGESIKA